MTDPAMTGRAASYNTKSSRDRAAPRGARACHRAPLARDSLTMYVEKIPQPTHSQKAKLR
jgi:hypothetical protein